MADIKIFISYSKHDKHLAGQIKEVLEKQGDISCFIAHDDVVPASEWEEEILANLRSCDVFMPLQTENLTSSYWCQQEAGISFERSVPIIPLMPDSNGIEPVGFYKRYQGFGIKVGELEGSIKKLLRVYDLGDLVRNRQSVLRTQQVQLSGKDEAVQHSGRKAQSLRGEAGNAPAYFLSITPIPLVVDVIDTGLEEIQNLILRPGEAVHRSGWNMGFSPKTGDVKPFLDGVEKSSEDWRLRLFRNGCLEFFAKVDYAFSWGQDEDEFSKQPRFNPYAVIGFPISFIRLYKELSFSMGLPDAIVLNMTFYKCGNYELRPYDPDSIWHRTRGEDTVRKIDDLAVEMIISELSRKSDVEGFKLVERLYNTFGMTKDKIPFFSKESVCLLGAQPNVAE